MSIGRWYRGWTVKGRYGKDVYSYLSGPCKVIRPYRFVVVMDDGKKKIEKIVNSNYETKTGRVGRNF